MLTSDHRAYKRTLRILLIRETHIQPLTLHSEIIINRAAAKTQRHPVEADIAQSVDEVLAYMRQPRPPTQRPATHRELVRQEVLERSQNEREKRIIL